MLCNLSKCVRKKQAVTEEETKHLVENKFLSHRAYSSMFIPWEERKFLLPKERDVDSVFREIISSAKHLPILQPCLSLWIKRLHFLSPTEKLQFISDVCSSHASCNTELVLWWVCFFSFKQKNFPHASELFSFKSPSRWDSSDVSLCFL